jgi:hypothetical protein
MEFTMAMTFSSDMIGEAGSADSDSLAGVALESAGGACGADAGVSMAASGSEEEDTEAGSSSG